LREKFRIPWGADTRGLYKRNGSPVSREITRSWSKILKSLKR